MPLYMSQFAYTSQAWAALTKHPEDRAEVLAAAAARMGAKIHSLHYCFGEYDGVVMLEAPDETTAMSVLLAVISAGHVKAIKTTVLISPRDAMDAMRKAGAAIYPAPKG